MRSRLIDMGSHLMGFNTSFCVKSSYLMGSHLMCFHLMGSSLMRSGTYQLLSLGF